MCIFPCNYCSSLLAHVLLMCDSPIWYQPISARSHCCITVWCLTLWYPCDINVISQWWHHTVRCMWHHCDNVITSHVDWDMHYYRCYLKEVKVQFKCLQLLDSIIRPTHVVIWSDILFPHNHLYRSKCSLSWIADRSLHLNKGGCRMALVLWEEKNVTINSGRLNWNQRATESEGYKLCDEVTEHLELHT